MTVEWKQRQWPKNNHHWWFESGEWRVEINGATNGYRIVVRRDYIMVDSRSMGFRGDGVSDHVKRTGEQMLNNAINLDLKPRHRSHL